MLLELRRRLKKIHGNLGLGTPHSKGRATPTQRKKGRAKMDSLRTTRLSRKKDTGKWCNFHKIPWHNTVDCRSKQSLVDEVKASESDAGYEFESKPERGRWIINAKSSSTISTTNIWPDEPNEPKEGEHLFHSHMWVKGTPLHFIVDSVNQKNLISVEVVKRLALLTTPHLQPYTIGWLRQGRDLRVSQHCHL
jgi:hypothetical protein